MFKRFLLIIVLFAAVFLAACGRAASESQVEGETARLVSEEMAASAPMEPAAMDFDTADGAGFSANTAVQEQPLPTERLITRTGDLSLVVRDTEEAMAQIAQMAEANGGWVVSSNVYQSGERAKRGSITVRVPSSGFNSAMEAMKDLAVEVTNESTSGQDVTEEFVDLSLRLENLEATADRVRGFMEEAENVEEALAVNQELSRLEGEIERIKGRVQFLSQSASYSTITVNLTPDALAQPIEVGGWRPQGVAREALEALVSTLQGLAEFLIWVVIYLLPVLLLLGIPAWLVVRFMRRRWSGRKDTPQEASG